MQRSDMISLTISRCCLNTPAPTRMRVHTHTCARTHKMFSFSFSRCSSLCTCVTDTGCVRVYISFIQKCFSAVRGRCNMRTRDSPLVLQTHPRFSAKCTNANAKMRNASRSSLTLCFAHAAASTTTKSKASPREPSWETLSSKPCK